MLEGCRDEPRLSSSTSEILGRVRRCSEGVAMNLASRPAPRRLGDARAGSGDARRVSGGCTRADRVSRGRVFYRATTVPYSEARMGPLAAILLALAAAHVQVAAGSLQQCYVCEPRGGDTVGSLSALFHDQQPVLKCEDFKKDDARFVKNCPEEYKGCLTQSVVIGHHVTRTCGDLKVNDCQVANGVQYCYCSGALCNGQTQDPPPDDEPEDSVEGSASGEDAAAKHRHKQQQTLGTPPTTPTSVVLPTTHASSHVKGATAAAATRTNHKLSLVLTLVPCLAVAVGARRRY